MANINTKVYFALCERIAIFLQENFDFSDSLVHELYQGFLEILDEYAEEGLPIFDNPERR